MGTSTVTIEGGAFVIRTGNLLTKFKSMESAADQIALLHDVIGMNPPDREKAQTAQFRRLAAENAELRAQLAALLAAAATPPKSPLSQAWEALHRLSLDELEKLRAMIDVGSTMMGKTYCPSAQGPPDTQE